MSKQKKKQKVKKPKPRIFSGFRDVFSEDILLRQRMIDTIRRVYEKYGYLPLETPAIEYVDILGKFLPESTTPQGGVFSFRNPDLSEKAQPDDPNTWLALRYDLTAPLARVFAQYVDIQRPFRRYQVGPVWRYEKPGPGRFREFYQFDFDSVGTSSMAADAEICCVICDALAALGFSEGEYMVKVNNRKIMQGVLEVCGLADLEISESSQAMTVLRAIDKMDRLGLPGVIQLLGKGRRDESGDFTEGAHLENEQIAKIEQYLGSRAESRDEVCRGLFELVKDSEVGRKGVAELQEIDSFLSALGYNGKQVEFDPTIVRGLSYYTGPVFEGVLTKEIKDESGQVKQIGSVFGGGRYDDLVKRFTGQEVPATGASIGVDRLLEAMRSTDNSSCRKSTADVLVTVMDKKCMADYFKLAQEIREAGINAELYLGNGNIGKQMKYADKQEIPLAIIIGSDEFEKKEAQVKDLNLGRKLSEEILDREEWREENPAQQSISRSELISKLREMLG